MTVYNVHNFLFKKKKKKKSSHGRLGELRPRDRRSGSVYSNVSIVPVPRHYPMGVFVQKKFSESSSEKGGGGGGDNVIHGPRRWAVVQRWWRRNEIEVN